MSSQYSAAFSRAMSPTLDALTQAVVNNTVFGVNDEAGRHNALIDELATVVIKKIAECRSVDQVIDCVFFDYRAALREFLLNLASWCDKRETVKASLERLESAVSAGNTPNRLKVKAPEFQLTKEFADAGSAEALRVSTTFSTARDAFQKAINDGAIQAKKDELTFWDDKCALNSCYEAAALIVKATYDDRKSSYKLPVFSTDNKGVRRIAEWVVSPQKKAECSALQTILPAIFSHIKQIVNMRHRALAIKIEKKRTTAATADVEMADATKPGPSIQSLIDKGLNARLKKLNLGSVGKKASFRNPSPIILDTNYYSNYPDFVWPEFVQGSSTSGQESWPFETQVVVDAFATQASNQGFQQGRQQEEREGESSRQERSKGKGKGKSLDARSNVVPFTSVRPAFPNSIPDDILTMTKTDAVSFVHLHTPISFLLAGQYRSSVHCSPGVSVPVDVANDLSLGLNYMFFTLPSKSLIMQAWNDFQRRIRWRIYFLFKEGMNKPFDPDYGVSSKKKEKPPVLPQYMELGLSMGRRYVQRTIASIPEEALTEMRKHAFSPKRDKIRKFLIDNNYVITMTDKNLGLAVSERDWILRNELNLLEDERNYEELEFEVAQEVMKSKMIQMQTLARTVEDEHLFLFELGLSRFFLSNVPEDGSSFKYPQFHGIPKIHKKPTGFRPIIPCHSVVFNPAAKFVSKELKPIIKSTPSIIHGTKDLFTRLSQLRIDPKRQWYFVTGDVVAFYPNIPLDLCIEIVCSMYEEWLLNASEENTALAHINPNSLENNLVKLGIFKRAIEIGNTQLITQHGSRYFRQKNGLAMGVADSPDLANLFGAHFEIKSKILDHPNVAFYGRYIDDCFAIVYAESETLALNLIKETIKFDGCVIEWAVSLSGCQFLDAFIFKESGKLHWKPFVKTGNNRERIPWVSHHPLDVKRGVYIGELSRLAVLCSTKEIYIGAIRDLNALYLMRGYPENLVMSWCKKNIQERWEKRFALRVAEHDESILVLKTRFDQVWNWFSAAELGKTITEYWSAWYKHAEKGLYSADSSRPLIKPDPNYVHDLDDVRPELFTQILVDGETEFVPDLRKIGLLGSRWIVSRKRNTNLFDLANVWKKTVFRKLDEDIAEKGGVVPETQNVNETYHSALVEAAEQISIESDNEIILHRRSISQEREHPEFGRISKSYNR
uniref:Reverse transcriptase domain-containing protein n=1 Tax=Psilocybe cubensis TaxID=181762 RepID=A0A8H7XZR0_PSICU